jgi:hypothetical protein
MPLLTTEAADQAALASLIAAATLLGADLKAGLFTNTVAPSKTLTLTDLTEPTYGSYARQVVVMGPVVRDPAVGICSRAAGLLWQQTGTPTPTIVKGIFYLTGGTPYLVGVEVFPVAIPLNDLLDAFTSVLQYNQSNQNQGATTIIQ